MSQDSELSSTEAASEASLRISLLVLERELDLSLGFGLLLLLVLAVAALGFWGLPRRTPAASGAASESAAISGG